MKTNTSISPQMYSRSLLLRIDKLNIQTMSDAVMMREYLESFVCYIAKKVMLDAGYPQMDVRYDYVSSKIDNAFNVVEHLALLPNWNDALMNLNNVLTRSIEEAIHEFYMSDYAQVGSLNLNSMLVNCDSLLITYEFFRR